MSRTQDFKDTKKAFKEAAATLDNTLEDFNNNHDISKYTEDHCLTLAVSSAW